MSDAINIAVLIGAAFVAVRGITGLISQRLGAPLLLVFATSLRSYRVAAPAALTLATLGLILTAAFMGVGAHYLLELPWIELMMLGANVASTDAAAVFFLMRVGGITVRDRVKSTLEIESGAQRSHGNLPDRHACRFQWVGHCQ